MNNNTSNRDNSFDTKNRNGEPKSNNRQKKPNQYDYYQNQDNDNSSDQEDVSRGTSNRSKKNDSLNSSFDKNNRGNSSNIPSRRSSQSYSSKLKDQKHKNDNDYGNYGGKQSKNNNNYDDYDKNYLRPNYNANNYDYSFDKETSGKGEKRRDGNNYYDNDNSNSLFESSPQISKNDLFERQNDYDVSDGQSDDSLNISDLGDEDELRKKRYQSKERFSKRQQVQEWEIEYSFKKFRANMKQIMTKKQINLRTIFRQLDVDNDSFITYIDFCKGLSQMNSENHIYFDLNDFDLITCLFERLDLDRQNKISFDTFRQAIYKTKENQSEIKNLLKKVRLNFNEKDKQALDQYFKKCDQNKDGRIQFKEFRQALLKFELEPKDIDALFIYFDKLKQNEIGYQEFQRVLFEDYMIKSNIANTIQDYINQKSMTLRQLYGTFSDPETKTMSIVNYIKMMKQIGFKYSESIIEETFDFFDDDKNGSISFEEFEKTIYDENSLDSKSLIQKVPILIRTIRRQSLNRGIDIVKKLQNVQRKTKDQISFNVFSDSLRECGVDVKQYEKEAIFNFYRKQNNPDYLDADRIGEAILIQRFDISFIKERLFNILKRYNLTYGQLFSFFDTNQNETINFEEFNDLLDVIQVRLTIEEASEAFATFDINQDGDVTQDEFIRILEGKDVEHLVRFDQIINNLKLQEKAREPKSMLKILEHKGIKVEEEVQIKDILDGDEGNMKISEDSIYFVQNQQSLSGKIQLNNQQEMYLKFVAEDPGILNKEFDFKQVMDVIVYNVQKLSVDFFHEFVRVDAARHFVLIQVSQFQDVLQNVDIFFTKEIIDELYLLFINIDNQFEYIKFLMNIYNPFYLFKRVFIYQMQIQNYGLSDMIFTIQGMGSKTEETITYDQKYKISAANFIDYCFESYMKFEKSSFQYIWTRLNPREEETIGIEEFAIALNVPLNYHPFQDLNNYPQHQLDVINEFSVKLIQSCNERNINLIEIFLYFDKECSFKLTDACQLIKIQNLLQVRMANLEVKAIYTYLSQSDPCRQMQYVELIKKAQLPQIYLQSILWIFLRMEQWTLPAFFDHFKKEDTWDIDTLKEVISFSRIKGLSKEIEKTFKIWTNGKDKITLSDLGKILNIGEQWSHREIELSYLNRQNGNIKNLIHLIDVTPSANENHYLFYYINEPTMEYLQNQRLELLKGESKQIKERQKEARGAYLTIQEEQSFASAASLLEENKKQPSLKNQKSSRNFLPLGSNKSTFHRSNQNIDKISSQNSVKSKQ